MNRLLSSILRLIRTRTFLTGFVWALFETGILTVAIFQGSLLPPNIQALSNNGPTVFQLVLLLGTTIALIVGYIQIDAYKSIRTFLVSKLVAVPSFFLIALLTVPGLWDFLILPQGAPSLAAQFVALYIMGILFAMIAVQIFATLIGTFLGDNAMSHKQSRLVRVTRYRTVILGILLLVMIASAGLLALNAQAQIDRLRSDNLGLQQTNKFLHDSLTNPQQHFLIARTDKAWSTGQENITIVTGSQAEYSGYLLVSWSSTVPVSFYSKVLDTVAHTPSGTTGSFKVPVVAGEFVDRSSWFHNDGCTMTGCPAGSLTYTIELYQ